MEIDITMLLVLPTSMGGYQTPFPLLNLEVRLHGEWRGRAKQRTREAVLERLGYNMTVITERQVFPASDVAKPETCKRLGMTEGAMTG